METEMPLFHIIGSVCNIGLLDRGREAVFTPVSDVLWLHSNLQGIVVIYLKGPNIDKILSPLP